MSKVNVNRRAKKSDMVKRLDLCIKTCSVNYNANNKDKKYKYKDQSPQQTQNVPIWLFFFWEPNKNVPCRLFFK